MASLFTVSFSSVKAFLCKSISSWDLQISFETRHRLQATQSLKSYKCVQHRRRSITFWLINSDKYKIPSLLHLTYPIALRGSTCLQFHDSLLLQVKEKENADGRLPESLFRYGQLQIEAAEAVMTEVTERLEEDRSDINADTCRKDLEAFMRGLAIFKACGQVFMLKVQICQQLKSYNNYTLAKSVYWLSFVSVSPSLCIYRAQYCQHLCHLQEGFVNEQLCNYTMCSEQDSCHANTFHMQQLSLNQMNPSDRVDDTVLEGYIHLLQKFEYEPLIFTFFQLPPQVLIAWQPIEISILASMFAWSTVRPTTCQYASLLRFDSEFSIDLWPIYRGGMLSCRNGLSCWMCIIRENILPMKEQ